MIALLCTSAYRDRLIVAVVDLANASTISLSIDSIKFLKTYKRESCEALYDIHLVKLLNETEGYTH